MPRALSVNMRKKKREGYLSNTGCRAPSKVDGGLFYRGEKCYRVPGRSQWKHQTVSDQTHKTRVLQT